MTTSARTIETALAILCAEGASSWANETDEDCLGCTLEEFNDWLCSEDESELRSWARSVANDEPESRGDA